MSRQTVENIGISRGYQLYLKCILYLDCYCLSFRASSVRLTFHRNKKTLAPKVKFVRSSMIANQLSVLGTIPNPTQQLAISGEESNMSAVLKEKRVLNNLQQVHKVFIKCLLYLTFYTKFQGVMITTRKSIGMSGASKSTSLVV